jgi:hypothetical protein
MPALDIDDEGYVYFVTFDFETVKVGFATDVRARLLQMQVSSPVNATEIACYPGTLADERRVHYLLRDHHVKREWFALNDDVDDFIADLLDALIEIQFEHGQDYEPTLKECLDHQGLGTPPTVEPPEFHDARRAKKAEMDARLARIRAKASTTAGL